MGAKTAPRAARSTGKTRPNKSDRDPIEEAYRWNEAVLKSVFEAAPVGILLTQRRNIQAANKALLRMLGYAEEELVEKSTRLLYPDDAQFERAGQELTHRLDGEPIATIETVWQTKDGRHLDVEVIARPCVPGDLFEGIVIAATDITERKRAATELHDRMSFERLILDLSNRFINMPPEEIDQGIEAALGEIGMFAGVDRCGIILFRPGNKLMDNTHAWQREGLDSRKYSFQGMDIELFPTIPQQIMAGKIFIRPRTDILPDGSIEKQWYERATIRSLLAIPLFYQGRVTGFFSQASVRSEHVWTEEMISLFRVAGEIFAGAIERRRAQEALIESERKYRTLIEYGLVGYFIQQDFVIRFCSRTFARIFGYDDPADLIGHSVRELVAPEDWDIVANEVGLRLRGEKEFSHYEFNGLKRDGTPIVCEVLGARIEYGGKPALQGAVLDVTDRSLAEKKIRTSLREKEVLIREIYHRTKNNMQVISSLISLQSRKLTDPKAEELFRETQQRIRTMALVHEQLYQSQDLSRIDFGIYLRILGDHLLRFHRIESGRIGLEIETADIALDIQTAVPLGLIANEIVSNSFKHAFPDGRPGMIRLRFQREPDGGLVLEIRDNGVGMPAEIEIGKTDSLGLGIIISLVDQINGRLDLVREGGTAFRISFREVPYPSRIAPA